MTAFYQELTALRKSSPLFTLGDGATVMQRVDFRNTGADQQTGLLVMTIDDGMQAGASLDSRVDGIVVAINAAPESRTLQDFAGTSLQLSAIQQAAGDRSLPAACRLPLTARSRCRPGRLPSSNCRRANRRAPACR